MRKLATRADFEALNEAYGSGGPLPVMLEDKRMGMCNHWNDEVVLVDAYRGDDHECLRIPFPNFFHLSNGALFAGLKGVV